MLNCREFVNADNIAAGISPFNPAEVAFEAGRIMLQRVYELLDGHHDFAFETTLATRSYVSFLQKAREQGYKVTLLYFWLSSPLLAQERVAARVKNGGHHIPDDIVVCRYYRGISNMFNLFIPISDVWMVIDNSVRDMAVIAKGEQNVVRDVNNTDIWGVIQQQVNEA